MAFNRFETDVENIQKLDDRPQITAQELKACFDQAAVDIKTAVNGLMTQLEATSSAGNLGATALGDEYVATTIQGILAELKAVCDLLKNADNITANSGEGWPTETLTARLNRIKTTIDNLIIGQIPADSINNSQLAIDNKVGSLALLNTTTKTDVVSALNEVFASLNALTTLVNTTKADNKKTWTTTLDTTWQETPVYALTSDVAIDSEKTYYTRTGSGTSESPYVYTAVEEPDVADIATYYEVTSGEAPYTKTVSLTGMLATYVPVLDVIYSNTNETAIHEAEEYAKISKIESGAGIATLTCFVEKPSIALNVRVEVMF